MRESAIDDRPDRPMALPVNGGAIPAELQERAQWVVWRYVQNVDPETGEVDWDKPPVNARTGRLASSTNPETWTTFSTAIKCYHNTNDLDGIGFALHREKGEVDGIVGIDLDKCRDPETGTIEQWALEIVRAIDSYTEVSPSGRGLRIFLRGNLPPTGRKKGKYENYQTGRYVTVTGQHIEGTPRSIESRQAELEQVHRGIFGNAPKSDGEVHQGGGMPTNLDDAEIVRRAMQARNGAGSKFRRLWSGETSGHNSASEADLALCNYLAFWCGPDPERIADLFAQSGLYRSKWNREDYRQRTILKALAGRTEFYTPRSRDRVAASRPSTNGGGEQGPPETKLRDEPDQIHLTDLGNARRVVQRHGRDLRYCFPWRKWLTWDSKHWAVDDTSDVTRRCKETLSNLFQWAAGQIAALGFTEEKTDE